MISYLRSFGLALSLSAVAATSAAAFGTLGIQGAQHERITRRALGCGPGGACVDPRTLTMIAGDWSSGRMIFGAVGAADRSTTFLVSAPHCDNGDHGDGPGYPETNWEGLDHGEALEACRAYAHHKLSEAVDDAGRLLDPQGRLRAWQAPTSCVFWFGVPGRAKCNAIEALGFALHTSQDFYAHTNWVDRLDAGEAFMPGEPAGLGQDGPAPWMALTDEAMLLPLPTGLVSGCFSLSVPLEGRCDYSHHGVRYPRITHTQLNKDRGSIGEQIGVGETPRGALGRNFQRAVEAATADTAAKWALFGVELQAKYGVAKGRLMMCALAHDRPVEQCAELQAAVLAEAA